MGVDEGQEHGLVCHHLPEEICCSGGKPPGDPESVQEAGRFVKREVETVVRGKGADCSLTVHGPLVLSWFTYGELRKYWVLGLTVWYLKSGQDRKD